MAVGAAATIAMLGSGGGLDEKGGLHGAAAAPTTVLIPARIAHRRPEAPPIDSSIVNRPGVLLIFLIEAAGPQALFAR